MTASDAHALMRTVDCSHPGCKEEADPGRSTCRYHRADRATAALVEREVAAGRLCKVADCAQPPAHTRGPFAGLCDDHADAKRMAHSARVSAGMGHNDRFTASPDLAATPLGVVKKLQQAARDLERAQRRHDEAKAELNRCKRAWKTALQDAAIST